MNEGPYKTFYILGVKVRFRMLTQVLRMEIKRLRSRSRYLEKQLQLQQETNTKLTQRLEVAISAMETGMQTSKAQALWKSEQKEKMKLHEIFMWESTKMLVALGNSKTHVYTDFFNTTENIKRVWALQRLCNIISLYDATNIPDKTNRVIAIFTEKTTSTGLVDRLRTACTGYIMAKESGLDFYLYHDLGFELSDYLLPNKVDWKIEWDSISFNPEYTSILAFYSIFRKLARVNRDYHVYQSEKPVDTFTPDKKMYSDNSVFNELFRFSDAIINKAHEYLQLLHIGSQEYTAVHCRFLNFFELVETTGSVTSTEQERENMIHAVHETIQEIYRETGLPVILFSDSNMFLNATHPEFVHVIPGVAGHVSRHKDDEEIIKKTFVDLYIMSKAKTMFCISGKNLYQSGFSRFAATIGNIPFKRVPLHASEAITC